MVSKSIKKIWKSVVLLDYSIYESLSSYMDPIEECIDQVKNDRSVFEKEILEKTYHLLILLLVTL